MEKHRCKLCLRKFANGRALGGHVRSHMMNLYVTEKKEEQQQEQHKAKDDQQQLSAEYELVQSSEEENEENSKKSKRFVDPECSFAVETGSVVLQDRESETESSKNQNCRRSKRVRKSRILNAHPYCIDHQHNKEPKGNQVHKCAKKGKPDESSSFLEPEPVSSISDTTPEEDVAYCLMMLSRDKWMKEKDEEDGADEEQEEEAKKCVDDHSKDAGVVKVTKARCRGKYRCETCNKVFKSYQALGGHRASHKKMKVNNDTAIEEASQVVMETENAGGATANISVAKPISRMIDLNLPAPLDDDDDDEINQMELSTVSDAECVNPIRQ